MEAINNYNLKEGFIVTEAEKETMEVEGKKIHIIPFYGWLEQTNS